MNIRIFLSVLILIFSYQSWTIADDISEFEIEGMSIGDSALEYFNKEELIEFKEFYRGTDSKKFFMSSVKSSKFKKYDDIMFHFKENDPLFKIYSISAAIWFSETNIKNIRDCIKIRNKLTLSYQNYLIILIKTLKTTIPIKVTLVERVLPIPFLIGLKTIITLVLVMNFQKNIWKSHLKVMVNSHELVD